MGTLRTIIGVWFQFTGSIAIIIGMALLIFGGGALTIPTFDIVSTLPFASTAVTPSLIVPPDLIEPLGFDPETQQFGCIPQYVYNSDLGFCQRIGSSLNTLHTPTSGSLSSLLGFSGLMYLGVGIFNVLIGTVIRRK